MRVSAVSALLALPVMGAAEGIFDQYKAQFQNLLGSFGAQMPEAPKPAQDIPQAAPAKAKVGSQITHVLTKDNWKQVLYGPVKEGATTPEEWWVLITGGNRTCFGRCNQVETAFNETVAKFALLPNAPHMAILNCEDESVLCNSWSTSTASIWKFEMLPPPAKTNVYTKRLNTTSTTSQTLEDLRAGSVAPNEEGFTLHEGYFHPFDGPMAQYGLAVPFGYVLQFFNVVPSWAMMLAISFISRSVMGRRTGPGGVPNPAAGGAPRGAPPGDATR